MITANQVKELREITWIWMMECKKALEITNWDMEKAIEELRKKGLAKAAKKADRETFEWWIKVITSWGKGYMISVSCETDFLANSDKFKEMLQKTCEFLRDNWADSREDAQEFINKNYSLELGENLQVKDYKVISWGKVVAYVHSNWKLASIVVAKDSTTDEEKLKQVAMHVTAANPEYLSPDDISEEVVEKEKAIQLEIMKVDPKMTWKPDDVLLKIIEGKMWKFKSDVSLLEQPFVINPDQKVKDFIWANTLEAFYRFSI